jgi:tungstate transport system substrate-binding protein
MTSLHVLARQFRAAWWCWLAALPLAVAAAMPAVAQARFITMASTTSTEQSGLFGHLLPRFREATGIEVRVVAVGTGQALDIGRRGDADLVFVHDTAAEEKFVAEGFAASRPAGYRECGCGMGPALNMASASGAYVLADRGTWLAFRNRDELAVLVEGDRRLFNPHGVMVVSRPRHPHVKSELAQQFADWVVSPAGQQAIADYRIGGEPLFFPSAR